MKKLLLCLLLTSCFTKTDKLNGIKYKDSVKIVKGFYRGCIGTVNGYEIPKYDTYILFLNDIRGSSTCSEKSYLYINVDEVELVSDSKD